MSKISVSIKGAEKYKKLADEFHGTKIGISVDKEIWIYDTDEIEQSLKIWCTSCKDHFETEEHFTEAHTKEKV